MRLNSDDYFKITIDANGYALISTNMRGKQRIQDMLREAILTIDDYDADDFEDQKQGGEQDA